MSWVILCQKKAQLTWNWWRVHHIWRPRLLHLHRIYLHHTATSYKNDTWNTLVINKLLHSAVGVGIIHILLPHRWFPLAKLQRTLSQEVASCSDKNRKKPCRDARASPYVSSWCRRASKQASARRHREETAFVPQACITARKTEKTADAAIFSQPT